MRSCCPIAMLPAAGAKHDRPAASWGANPASGTGPASRHPSIIAMKMNCRPLTTSCACTAKLTDIDRANRLDLTDFQAEHKLHVDHELAQTAMADHHSGEVLQHRTDLLLTRLDFAN